MGPEEFEIVKDFIYLGSQIANDYRSEPELNRHRQLARYIFGLLAKVWHSSSIQTTS